MNEKLWEELSRTKQYSKLFEPHKREMLRHINKAKKALLAKGYSEADLEPKIKELKELIKEDGKLYVKFFEINDATSEHGSKVWDAIFEFKSLAK